MPPADSWWEKWSTGPGGPNGTGLDEATDPVGIELSRLGNTHEGTTQASRRAGKAVHATCANRCTRPRLARYSDLTGACFVVWMRDGIQRWHANDLRPGGDLGQAGCAGGQYIGVGDWENAKRNLELAQAIDPQNAEVFEAFALVYQSTGEFELAEQQFKAALKADPDLSRAHHNYAAFLYSQGGLLRRRLSLPG